MSDSIFDRIIRREIPADIVYEDDDSWGVRAPSPEARGTGRLGRRQG